MSDIFTTDESLAQGLEYASFIGLVDAAVDKGVHRVIYIKRYLSERWVPLLEVIPIKPIPKLVPLEGHPQFGRE